MTAQDHELSAALGWPGGIGDPVLDRKTLLQMVAALRLASQQALEALYQAREFTELYDTEHAAAVNEQCHDTIATISDALAQEQTEPDISRCPQCNGPADNGFDRSFPPSPYLCTKCIAEPVQVAERERVASQWDGCVTHQLDTFGPVDIGASIRAGELVEAQQAEPVQEPVAWHYRNNGGASVMHWCPSAKLDADMQVAKEYPNAHKVTPLYTAPPQRTMVPLTEEEIAAMVRAEIEALPSYPSAVEELPCRLARAIEKAVWEKNK